MGDHFQVSSHGDALKETQEKHQHYQVSVLALINSFIWTTYDCLQSSFIHSLYIGWPLNSLMACEELLQHPVCVYKCVCVSSTKPNVSVYTKRTSSRKKEHPSTQMPFVPVSLCLHFFVSTSKIDLEGKERGLNDDGALLVSSLAPRRLGWRCQRVRSAATFPALTLKRARSSVLP